MATRKSSRDGNKSDGSDDDTTNSGTRLAQISYNKKKGQRGARHKFKKMLNLSPPISPSSTPEPVPGLSGSNISVTEEDKCEHGGKWKYPVLRSSEHSESSPCNPSQINVSTLPATHVHVTKQFRPVTQRSKDYNSLSDVVSLCVLYIYIINYLYLSFHSK